jgi:hypothetical protein
MAIISKSRITNTFSSLSNLLANAMSRAINFPTLILAFTHLMTLTSLWILDMSFLATSAVFTYMGELALASASLFNALVSTLWVT